MSNASTGYNADPSLPQILRIHNKNKPPQLNKVKNRVLILSPTVNSGLERECSINDFIRDKQIGRGGFGQVWRVMHKATKQIYCIKIIEKNGIINQKLVEQMNREIEIMYKLNHPHCLRLKNHFEDEQNFYLIMPLCQKGQIYTILKKQRKFSERTTAQFLRETISALQYMHSFNPPIIHRDLKPENLLLDNNLRVYLADYGWSNFKKENDVRNTFCGTPEYIAPEMLRKEGHDHRIDIWCVGVLMFEFLSGYSPFFAKTNQDLYSNIRRLRIQWPKDMPPLAKNLIQKILKINPLERISFEEMLKHTWFETTKEVQPLLDNPYKNEKDLLMFHMINTVTPEIEKTINAMLGVREVKVITPVGTLNKGESESVTKALNKSGSTSSVTTSTASTASAASTVSTSSSSSSLKTSSSANASIDINKEQMDNLRIQTTKLSGELLALKNKQSVTEIELRALRDENGKLKDKLKETSSSEETAKLKEELEKYKIREKERLALLSELEERNSEIRSLKAQLNLLQKESEQKQQDNQSLHAQLADISKQLEFKEMTIEQLTRKNDSLLQEKEAAFYDYQKKLELMQIKLLSSTSEEGSNEGSISKAISIFNESIQEIKLFFQKKFNIFIENFDLFKKEYNNRDDKFTALLNEKSLLILEQLHKMTGNIENDITKVFNKANKPNNDVKEDRIKWLTKRVTDLTASAQKVSEMERQVKVLEQNCKYLTEKNKVLSEENEAVAKESKLIKDTIHKKNEEVLNLSNQLGRMKHFMYGRVNMEELEKFYEMDY